MLLTMHLRGEMSARGVTGRFSHAWPMTTRHVRVLEHAGLVHFEREAGGGCTVWSMLGWGS